MVKNVNDIEIEAIVNFCEETKLYTISSNNQGGPIITNEDLLLAKQDFETSMALSIALLNLENMVLGKDWLRINFFEYSNINYN